MKKVLSLLVGGFLILSLSSCGKKEKVSNKTSDAVAEDSNKTLVKLFIPSGATTKLSRMYMNMVTEFEKQNDDIDVKFEAKGNWNDVLTDVIAITKDGGNAGVLVAEISELLTLKDANAIIPLNKLIDGETGGKKGFLKPIIPGFLANSYGDDGKLYGLPLMRSTPIIYYNMDILKESGITEKKLPKNWKDLTKMLKKIKAKTGKAPFGLAPSWFDWLFESFVRQNGGSLANKTNTQVKFDDPKTIGALKYWKSLKDQGLLFRHKGSWKAAMNGFKLKHFPVLYYSTGGMGGLAEKCDFDWTTDIMPKSKIHSAAVGAGNLFLSSNMNEKEKTAAWKLLKFLLNTENQAKISHKSGYFPVAKEAFNHPLLKERYKMKQFKKAKKQLDYANAKIMTRNYMEIRKVLKSAIDRSLNEGMDPKKSLKIAQKEAQKWLKK